MNTYFAPCGHKFNRSSGGAPEVTVEVTGTAFALDCFSCQYGRRVPGDNQKGPKVFCVCTSHKNEEAKQMGKINVGNINAGLNKVKSITESLSNISRYELIPLEYIEPAKHNPFAEGDTDQSRYEVAMSIQTNGLLEPLVVNKKSPIKYTLIAGEHRYTAIKQYLSGQFKNVSCMIFEGLSDDEAELKLYEANRQREYTPEQKFRRYQELEKLLIHMKESGEYHGSIQKGLAELIGVSTRQIRKYQTITQKLTPDQQQAVVRGDVSINDACQVASSHPEPVKAPDVPKPEENKDNGSGTGSAFFSMDPQPEEAAKRQTESKSVALSRQEFPPKPKSDEPDSADRSESEGQENEIDSAYWDEKIRAAIKTHYNPRELYRYYTFQVPTTLEAIREKLKPKYGFSGGTVDFSKDVIGFCDARSDRFEIKCGKHYLKLTYSQVDEDIREMIRHGELLTKKEIQPILEETKIRSLT